MSKMMMAVAALGVGLTATLATGGLAGIPLLGGLGAGLGGAATAAGLGTTAMSIGGATVAGSGLMGALGTGLGAIGSIMPSVGTIAGIAGAGGGVYGAIQAKEQSTIQAKSLVNRGNQEKVRAEQRAEQLRKEGAIAASRANAIAAASGAPTTPGDSTSMNMAKIDSTSKFNQLTALYNGWQAAHDDYSEAKNVDKTGTSKAIGGLIDTGTSAYSSYVTRGLVKKYPGFGTYNNLGM